MLSFHNAFCILSLLLTSVCTAIDDRPVQQISNDEGAKQELWMRVAIQALRDLNSPCPFEAFGTAVVNHTSTHDDLICIGANAISTGNPTLHGEIAAINNCTAVLSDPNGKYGLSPAEVLEAYKDLTLYTTAEPCPMCASAIRWAGFHECVFGTSIATLGNFGWSQIDFTSHELFRHASGLKTTTKLIGGVLSDETDGFFAWQFDELAQCPLGCERDAGLRMCTQSAFNADEYAKTEL
ncbi:hypothetical protein LTR02_008106 [Friedmanniomyces endolithicus]|uniref:CMP/dCMP-type deaminase domain-containing protein n=1 Tax=Friedmanniomyces endolithicus TaxID=329885 RepID=A0A4U0USM2_9PEZI|nr:hypothetical protein LTS09_009119 [Friedmanniomyces endolithicus]KAK0770782.1 hypothetical protein LTR59_016357 [Friedmanniomyces endolithicus]KAK0775758.1 hypothetical protein LTR38_015746 [Friedmanniomyces endolithicus]KAK0821873.1 hypothetical protein LTR75_000006 [Friedmanniomyces endolithicus]KAK0853831.1 hypothetical protein LTS02_011792 [Friedmanniomyces endolithicus]